jgi:hypothetical protein
MKGERPAGVTAIAGSFLVAAAYLLVIGLTMLACPGLISMAAGAPLLGGLELAGPYMFLLIALLGIVVGIGLLRLYNWARWAAILASAIGVLFLLPDVSSAVLDFHFGKLAWGGLGTIVRVMIVWYLFQEPVQVVFTTK